MQTRAICTGTEVTQEEHSLFGRILDFSSLVKQHLSQEEKELLRLMFK